MPINFRPVDLRHFTPEGIAEFQQMWQEVVDQINTLQGVHGPIPIIADLDLQGNRIKNVGAPVDSTDALSQTSADPLYSTAVQAKTMEAVGTKMLQTTRRLNDARQQHKISSDLNNQGSVPPSNVTGTLHWSTIAGSSITWTWTNIVMQLADLSLVGIKNSSLTVTGLANAQYDFFPYYDTQLGLLVFVADSVNGIGVPPVAIPAGASAGVISAALQQQNGDGRIALTASATGAQVTINGGVGNATLRQRG